ncbi:transporter [Ensifer sp. 1H6]|uniref:SphA family protein n=1 Tax=Ensifer sp. 1H6 TaxID=1911585 RepID=UPI001FD9FABD|nr:transporter [Ensifer sp. 1H6]
MSFWLPGQYGSFAAIAPTPGFSLPLVTYAYSGRAGAGTVLPRGDDLTLGLDGQFVGQFIVPSYAPDIKILEAQPNFSIAFLPAYSEASAEGQLGGFDIDRSDSITGFGDLYPTAQLFWNPGGVHNWMAYVTGDIPVGSYSSSRLANIGIGHAAIDVGGAYTYLNQDTGWEFSGTLGFTYNFENTSTDYTSGIDAHFDWAVAKFLSEQFFVGVAGYAYQQLTPDRGQPPILGDFKSRTLAVGPQVGYNFTAHGVPIYTNLRVYFEFDTENRMKGQGMFLTVNLPLSALAKAK